MGQTVAMATLRVTDRVAVARCVAAVLTLAATAIASVTASVTAVAESAPAAEQPAAVAPGRESLTAVSAYQAVPVARVADTRGDITAALQVPVGRVTPGVPLVLDLAGTAGLPDSGIAAVDLNIAVTAVARTGFLAVYPCDDGNDGTARLNFTDRPELGASAIAVQVLAQLDENGATCIESSAPAHVVVDTSGFLTDGGPLRPIPATRLFDTRTGEGAVPVKTAKPAIATPFPIEVSGVAGVPETGASAVLLSVAAVKGTAPGFVSVYPCASGYQGTANLNHRVDAPVANSVIAPLDENGEVCFHNSASVDLVVDISAWFAEGEAFDALEPSRAADTRSGVGGVPVGRLTPFEPLPIDLAGVGGVPTTGVEAVSLNVAAARGATAGFLAIFPCDEEWNGTASLNFQLGEPISNAALTPIAGDGTACVLASTPVDVIIDVNGWLGRESLAIDDAVTIEEDAGVTTIDVLANDVGTNAVTGVTQPDNGSVAITNGGDDLRYVPKADFCTDGASVDEPDTFTYTADPEAVTATVSVTVTCVDDAPIAVDDAGPGFVVAEDDGPLTVFPLANNTDVDGGPISIVAFTQPANGTVAGGGVELTYEPDPGYCNDGSPADEFTYTLDPGGATATVAMTVNCVNDAPLAIDDVFASDGFPAGGGPNDKNAIGNTTFKVGVAAGAVPERVVAGSLLANDTDGDTGQADEDTLTVSGVQSAGGVAPFTAATVEGGTVVVEADGTFTFTPAPGFGSDVLPLPTDSFDYTITDGTTTSTATATIEVSAPVWYVDSTAPSGGDGTSSSPFDTLASLNGVTADLDDAGDVIFLYSGTTDGDAANAYQDGLALADHQRLIGEPAGLLVDGTQLLAPNGAAVPPAITTTLSGQAGIELANGVVVDSVATRNTGTGPSGLGDGWSADGVGDISLHNVSHFGEGFHGFDVDGLVGDLDVTGMISVIGSTTATAISLAGSTAAATVDIENLTVVGSASDGVVISDNAVSVTISDGSIYGNAGTGLSVLGGSADVTYGGTVGVPTSNDGAVAVSGRQGGATTLSGPISDSGGDGIDILNSAGGSIVFSGAVDLSNGDGLRMTGNTAGSTSFTGPVTISGGTGISVSTPASSTATATFTDFVDIDLTTENGVAIAAAGAPAAIVSFDGGLDIDTTSGTAVSTTGGRLDISDATDQIETLDTTSGVVLSMVDTAGTVDLESVGNVLTTEVGTVVLDSVGTVDLGVANLHGQHVAGTGGFRHAHVITVDGATRFATDPASVITGTTVGSVNLEAVTDLAFAASSLASTVGPGGTGLALTDIAGGTFAVSGQTSSIGGSYGIRLTRSAATVTMGSVQLGDAFTTFAIHGLVLDDVTGPVDIDGGAIRNATSRAVWITGGTSTVDYGGTIDAATGYSAWIQDRTSGLVEFTGLVSANGSASGVNISNVTGGVSFSGGLDIDVSWAGPAFQASSSELTVISPLSGTTEISNSGGGAALVLTNSTVPVAGVTFDSVSASGAGGAVAVFGLTGPGEMRIDGGVITGDTAGEAISLWNSTAPVVLSGMTINGSAGRALAAVNMADLTVSHISVTDFGGDAAIYAQANGTASTFTLTAPDGQTSSITQTGSTGRAVEVRNFGTTDMAAVVDRLVTTGGATGVFMRAEGTGEFLATVGHPGADDPDVTTGGTPANVTINDPSDVAIDLEIFASVSTRVLLDDVAHTGAAASTGGLRVDVSAIGTGAELDLIVEDSTLQPTSGSGIELTYDTSVAFQTALDVLLERVDVGGGGLTASVTNAAEMNVVAVDSTFAGATNGVAFTVPPGPAGLAAAMCLDLENNSISGLVDDAVINGHGARYSLVDLVGSGPADVQLWLDAANDDGGDPGTSLETSIGDTGYATSTGCSLATAP